MTRTPKPTAGGPGWWHGLVAVGGGCLFLGCLAANLGVVPRPTLRPAGPPTPAAVADIRNALAAVVGVSGFLVWRYRSTRPRRPA